jgi:hypothetical protein
MVEVTHAIVLIMQRAPVPGKAFLEVFYPTAQLLSLAAQPVATSWFLFLGFYWALRDPYWEKGQSRASTALRAIRLAFCVSLWAIEMLFFLYIAKLILAGLFVPFPLAAFTTCFSVAILGIAPTAIARSKRLQLWAWAVCSTLGLMLLGTSWPGSPGI